MHVMGFIMPAVLNTDTNFHAPFHLQVYMHAFIELFILKLKKNIVQMCLADISSHSQGDIPKEFM